MKKELIFLGPPACGKGTQTEMLAKHFEFPHVDTGSLLRAEINAGTENGLIAKQAIDKGRLVPVWLVGEIIKNRLSQEDCKNGFILDGFPRNIDQADALAEMTDLDCALLINQTYDVIVPRLAGRRVCKDCTATTNVSDLKEYKCPKCGGELLQRDDDKEEVVLNRLKEYERQTAPLIEYYKNKGLLKTVNAATEIEATYQLVKAVLERV